MKSKPKWLALAALAVALVAVLALTGYVFSSADNKNLSKVTFAVS